MSIGKAQARALAEGFLNSVGNEPGEFKPVECITEAITIASEFAQLAANNCPVHQGKLAASIAVEQPEEIGNSISVSITMFKYGMFVDKGVKGTKGGTGKFAFKYDMPSKSMVRAFMEYIKSARLSTANIGGHSVSHHESKNSSIAKAQSAFAMARSVKQHGIKPVNFIAKAAQTIESKYNVVMQDALTKDLYNSLPDTL